MDNLSGRIAKLSPAKRALLELELREKSLSPSTEFAIKRRKDHGPAPLSFAQQRLWFLNQLEPENSNYNQPKAIRLNGPLDVRALQRALDQILDRHEVLRTTFTLVDGSAVQVIADRRTAELPVIDMGACPDTVREAEIHRVLAETIRRPFDLSRDLMLRALLLRLHEQEHILLLVTHHVASDGWSTAILWHELATLYKAFALGQPSPLPELPIQYADYATWQRNWLRGQVLENQLTYWKKQLSGISVLELPTDRPRPAVQTFRGVRRSFVLSEVLSGQLKNLSRKQGVTLFMTLLAAFQTLLHRYTGQGDIAIGTPIANRTRTEIEGLIGFFVNTLVLRTDFSGNPSFVELLARVRKVALGAYEYQDLPFEKLVEELNPDRNLSYTPLFQVMFALQNAPRSTLELPGLTATPVEISSGTAKFDLTLSLSEEKSSLRGSLEYNTDLFEAATITRMLDHFPTLLQGIVSNPEQRISELPVLTEAEKRQLLVEWNDTRRDYPDDKCIHELFEAQAERSPDAVAVVYGNKQVTYGQLNRQANQLAHYLRKLGIGQAVSVGICLERSLEMVLAVLGVLKAGGTYIPLDPSYPKERLAFMLEDAQIGVLLTQHKLLQRLPSHNARAVCLDSEWEFVTRESDVALSYVAGPENLAYIIYTSGSTGKPKGVQVPHRAVTNLLASMRNSPGLTEQDILLAVTTLSFDIAGLELFLPLSVGARIVLVDSQVAADGAQLATVLATCGATVMQATPSSWQLLREAGWQAPPQFSLLCGGESLPRDLADHLLQKASSVWNMYGPTETTIWSATHRVTSGAVPIPVGRPINNTQMYILDRHLNPVPIGVHGELYIGGAGLARGYLNRPDLTSEKFIPNPFSREPGARVYRTGDRARYLRDGNIEFLGRMDHQVKIRGFRIEPGEIEVVLAQHPGVRESLVVTRGDTGNNSLVAYVVLDQNSNPAESGLRNFVREKLPDYMVPAAFVVLDAFPLTPNGKVDRRALPAPHQTKSRFDQTFVAPSTELESELTQIWEEVLGVNPVGVDDNFFDLGGHSLLAVRLFARIRKFTGKNIPLATLFQAPTVRQLANMIGQQHWSDPWSSLVAIQPKGSKPPFFCVHAHDGHVLYFRYLAKYLGPDQPFYGIQAQGLDGKETPHNRVEDMAAHYIKEIRNLQPRGPYFLGANCAGGKVVFEMAQQFYAQGQQVAVLALIDSHAPGCHGAAPDSARWFRTLRYVAEKIEGHLINASLLEHPEKLDYIQGVGQWWFKTRIKPVFDKVFSRNGDSRSESTPEIGGTILQALKNYTPRSYSGRITLFRPAKQENGVIHDPEFGWRRLAGDGVETHVIPGYHGIIQEPRVRILAERLAACLHRAQMPGPTRQHRPHSFVHADQTRAPID